MLFRNVLVGPSVIPSRETFDAVQNGIVRRFGRVAPGGHKGLD